MKLIRYLIAVIALTILAGIALAQGPMPEVDVKKATDTLILGISTVNWVFICAGGGLVVIWLLRLLLIPKLKGKPLAIASCVLIGAAACLVTLIASPTDWINAIMIGVSAGMIAGKAWDLLPDKLTDAANKPIKKRANGG